jgi:protoheme IX farnesyltransferase
MSVPAPLPVVAEVAVEARPRRSPYLDLAKPRLNLLVLLTTLAGYYLGSGPWMQLPRLAWLMLGTGLVAAGASALNQWMERDVDGRMRRTRLRPLPSGRMRPSDALAFGAGVAVLGTAILGLAVNALAAALAAATCLAYLLLYTPLKTITPLNTFAGAVPGAIPPVIGWVAARGTLDGRAAALFGILFLWQMPHFLAIAWLHREDYERAGCRMLPLVRHGPRRTGLVAVFHALALLPAAALPALLGMAGDLYLAGSLVLSAAYLGLALRLALRCDDRRARRLFRGSLLYLPLLFALMALDKVVP